MSSAPARPLAAEPLTREAFAPFGEVLEVEGAELRMINEGNTLRFHGLAHVDAASEGGKPIVSLLRASRRELIVRMLERHPLSSQMFYPLSRHDWLVVVALGSERPDLASIRCFRATGEQGVNYACHTWHHTVLILHPAQDFLVVDREGPGLNLQEYWIEAADAQRTIVL
jgi:ureidoglycolate lyase